LLNTVLGSFSSGVAASTSSYESIASATGTGSSGTITFSSIPSTYKHLQIRYIGRTDQANFTRNLSLRFNSDSGGNYANHYLEGTGSAASASGSTTQTAILMNNSVYGASVASDILGVGVLDIHDYASTTKYKVVRFFTGLDNNNTSYGRVNLQSGLWLSTTAINSISFLTSTGNFTTQTQFALYGIKGE
jgi:hypothetical protein